MNYPKWQPVTETDPKPSDESIPWTMTKKDHDVVQLARIDIEASKRQFGRFTEGLCVTELSPQDLTTEQRVALGLEDA